MSDRLGWRARIGILVPAFNTTVQPEMEAFRPPGVTNHVARIDMPDGALANDADQAAVIASLGDDLFNAVKRVALSRPAVVVMGISIPTFWNGLAGMKEMKARLEDAAGVPVILGAEACIAALGCFPGTTRIGVMTPYQPIGDARVKAFFEEAGYSVPVVHSLKRPRGSAIAEADQEMLEHGLDEVARHSVDLVLQVGTNLAVADLVEPAARRINRPVVSINTALYWHGLRQIGVTDPIHGFGPLLAEF